MPELPEVETIRRQLEKACVRKRIQSVFVDEKDRFVFRKNRPQAVKKALLDARIRKVRRRGKYFWFELNRKPWILFHLGMTGNIEIRGKESYRKAWGGKAIWEGREHLLSNGPHPRFCRLFFELSDGGAIAFTDPRRFGRIQLVEDPLHEPPLNKLGPDPLEDFPNLRALQKLLSGRKAPIKSLLLDQHLFAGVGNWIADEVLYQAGISPHRLARDLSLAEIKELRAKTLKVIRQAVRLDADYSRYPDFWLFHDRWGKRKEAYTSRGYEIRHDTIGGRTSAWVPALQK
jgi:formamidopyrimidine-DNA glycosylase